jgi:hypothetical protein
VRCGNKRNLNMDPGGGIHSFIHLNCSLKAHCMSGLCSFFFFFTILGF